MPPQLGFNGEQHYLHHFSEVLPFVVPVTGAVRLDPMTRGVAVIQNRLMRNRNTVHGKDQQQITH